MSSGAQSTTDWAVAGARDEQNWLTIGVAEYSAIREEVRLLRTRRTFPHVDLMQRIAVPAALLAMVAGSIAAGLMEGGLDWLLSLSILSIVAGVAGFAWLESDRRRLRNLYADV